MCLNNKGTAFCHRFNLLHQTSTNARRTTEAAITSAGTRWARLSAAVRKATNCSQTSGRAKVSDSQCAVILTFTLSPSEVMITHRHTTVLPISLSMLSIAAHCSGLHVVLVCARLRDNKGTLILILILVAAV